MSSFLPFEEDGHSSETRERAFHGVACTSCVARYLDQAIKAHDESIGNVNSRTMEAGINRAHIVNCIDPMRWHFYGRILPTAEARGVK